MKNKIEIGAIFCVPLRNSGYGIGLIARKNRNILLGYFWKSIYQKIPTKLDYSLFNKKDVILIRQFAIGGLLNGEWPIIGKLPKFDPLIWEIPKFLRKVDEQRSYVITYNEKLDSIDQERIMGNKIPNNLYPDGLSGYGALEIRLTQLLDHKQQS